MPRFFNALLPRHKELWAHAIYWVKLWCIEGLVDFLVSVSMEDWDDGWDGCLLLFSRVGGILICGWSEKLWKCL